MIFKGGTVYSGGKLSKQDIRVDDGYITALGELEGGDIVNCEGLFILPMMTDIHTHGCLGIDFTKAREKDIVRMQAYYESHGVAEFLPTLISSPKAEYAQMLDRLGRKARLEGPFFGKEKKGAHDESCLMLPDYDMIMRLGDRVAMVDIDPTLPGGIELIYKLENQGIKTSAAHTAASYECACEAFDAGCRHVTHLYNAMNPLHHRESGLIGAAYDRKDVTVELICDGCHVSPAVLRMTFDLFPNRVCIISDSHATMGISQEDCARLPDGTIAGAVRGLDSALFNLPEWGIPIEKTVHGLCAAPGNTGLFEVPAIELSKPARLMLVNFEKRLLRVEDFGRRI